MLHPRLSGPVAAAALCAAIAGTACGKKSGPLAPFVRIPAAVTTLTATRLGSDVYVTLTVPARNIDNSLPGDVARIEVYGYTGTAAPSICTRRDDRIRMTTDKRLPACCHPSSGVCAGRDCPFSWRCLSKGR